MHRRATLAAATWFLILTAAGTTGAPCQAWSQWSPADGAGLRVGAAAVELEADDSMPIAGGIHPGRARGQEGKLRAVALVLEKPGSAPLAIVSCDVLVLPREIVDPVVGEIEKTCGIPGSNVLIHAMHTHHAPSTGRIHGCGRDELFCNRLKAGIVKAVAGAKDRLADSVLHFKLGEERKVGMNSRLLLKDGSIYWVGSREDAVRPTGPFDPDLPVLAFRSPSGKLQALLFGHSTHAIGTLRPGVRSPSFYGLAAQDLEAELGGAVGFLEGAAGSTHAYNITPAESFRRIKQAVLDALAKALPEEVDKVAALKRPFTFKVRRFDEAAEQQAVAAYCTKRIGPSADSVIAVFRQARSELAPQQGQERTTWLAAMRIGRVAIVGVPAELFTKLGLDIKRRSPFKHTVVVELANDWIGYTPDREAHKLGGYQVWTGLHSYAEPGTGERIVDQAVTMLEELAK
jgi:hypothetical protein